MRKAAAGQPGRGEGLTEGTLGMAGEALSSPHISYVMAPGAVPLGTACGCWGPVGPRGCISRIFVPAPVSLLAQASAGSTNLASVLESVEM